MVGVGVISASIEYWSDTIAGEYAPVQPRRGVRGLRLGWTDARLLLSVVSASGDGHEAFDRRVWGGGDFAVCARLFHRDGRVMQRRFFAQGAWRVPVAMLVRMDG
jgi:hypothetical protein